MSLCLHDLSALVCMRNGLDALEREGSRVAYGREPIGWPSSISRELAQRLDACGLSAPAPGRELHVLVSGGGNGNPGGSCVIAHAWPQRLPKGSIVDAGGGIATSSPEFLFLQMAQKLDTVDLVRLGLELCGRYRMGPSAAGRLFGTTQMRLGKEPLTNASRLRGYLARSPEVPGLDAARKAANLVADGLPSPHAAVIYLLLCLPNSLGGYGIAVPRPMVAALSSQHNAFARGDHLASVLFWPDAGVAVECATAEVPPTTDLMRMARACEKEVGGDDVRRVVLSAVDIADVATMHAVARQLSRRLGTRMPLLGRRFRSARADLRGRIIPTVLASSRAAWAA